MQASDMGHPTPELESIRLEDTNYNFRVSYYTAVGTDIVGSGNTFTSTPLPVFLCSSPRIICKSIFCTRNE